MNSMGCSEKSLSKSILKYFSNSGFVEVGYILNWIFASLVQR